MSLSPTMPFTPLSVKVATFINIRFRISNTLATSKGGNCIGKVEEGRGEREGGGGEVEEGR